MNALRANNTIDKVRKLQRKLYLTAKANKKRRFHALYDKVYRKDILHKAWEQVKKNGGTGGIDGLMIKDVKAYGEDKFLAEIELEIKEGHYRPQPVMRVYIPKKDRAASTGHGLNLQAGGSTIVWFSLTWSLELYEKANTRLWRQGQTETVVVHHIVAKGTIDEQVIQAIKLKARGQHVLMEAIKARIGGV